MNQEELKNNVMEYMDSNLYEESKKDILYNLLYDIENIEKLNIIFDILEDIINDIQFNLESNQDKQTFNDMTTIQIILKNIIENNTK